MRPTTMHQYNQSGELQVYHNSRAVYEGGGPEQPQQAPAKQAEAPKPPEAKVDATVNAPQAQPPANGDVVGKMKTGLLNLANAFLTNKLVQDLSEKAATEMNALTNRATGVVDKTNTVTDTAKQQTEKQIQPVVQKLAEAAPVVPQPLTEEEKKNLPPVDPRIAGQFDNSPSPAPAIAYDVDGLRLDPEKIVPGAPTYGVDGLQDMPKITEADVEAAATLKKSEALFDTTLKGKVTPKGWLNYLGDTNGIAQDIINTNIIADNYGTFTHANLMTKNFVVSSPVSTVEAIKYVQQSLGLTPDGIFGPITYDALVKKNPDAALILREEKPAEKPVDTKIVLN